MNIQSLLKLHQQGMALSIPYQFGSKPNPSTRVPLIESSDCSGWIDYLWNNCKSPDSKIPPEGSVAIHEYVKGVYPWQHYSDCQIIDGKLRIAFIQPTSNEAGHVWFIWNGFTIECHGGKGVNTRSWDNPILLGKVDACYVLS
jgi:hypothetical protein